MFLWLVVGIGDRLVIVVAGIVIQLFLGRISHYDIGVVPFGIFGSYTNVI